MENLCIRCGTCCGAYDGDPCVHLKKDKDERYYCEIYNSRFGMRKTVNGNTFRCVPVEKILKDGWFQSALCPYKALKVS